MKIGSIGAGNVGSALSKRWRAAGHDVRAGGRDSVAEVAAHGEGVCWPFRPTPTTRHLKPLAHSTEGANRRHKRPRRGMAVAGLPASPS
jgi:ketopantoate reductase